mgnify:FL=1
MAKFDAKAVAAMKEVFTKAQYIKKEWKTDESCTMTLQEYAELIDPIFSHVVNNPVIIAKERKDGTSIFLKMWIPLSENSGIEYDLSYENDFDEGEKIDVNTLHFCIERFLEKSHAYATGNVL